MTDDLATRPAGRPGISVPAPGKSLEPNATIGAEAAGSESEEVLPADPRSGGSRRLLIITAPVLALASLFGPIAASGIWEPPELRVADLSRRIAVALLGAKSLVVESGNNTVPTAAELGKGELPFTSIALGMRLFGLSEWAGRLPMALWGLVGILSTALLLARLSDKVTAAFATIVLATSPLYFLQARTMLGDIVTMAALALSTAGLGVAAFDSRPKPLLRLGFALLGVLGLAAGFGARGVLVGVVIPSLSIGISYRVCRPNPADFLGKAIGNLSLLAGVVVAIVGTRALVVLEPQHYSRLLGGTVEFRRGTLTHDAIVLELGHGLFPWSALAPFALAYLLRPPPGPVDDSFERESALRVLLGTVSIIGFGIYTAVVPTLGTMPFGAVFALAGAIAVLLRDVERGALMSRAFILGVASLLVLFYTDFKNFPEKGLAPFVVDDARFPESFRHVADQILKLGTVASAGLFALFAYEREEGQKVFDRAEYRAWPKALRTAYEGNLWVGAIAVEVSLIALAVVSVLNEHGFRITLFAAAAEPVRELSRYAFLVFPVVLVLPTMALAARDAVRIAVRLLRVRRGACALASIAAFGAVLSFAYYPTLARQISPKESFQAFRQLSRPGEELAMVGAGAAGSARYYAKRDVRSFGTATEAFTWLTTSDGPRKWLVIRAADLGQMNSQYRGLRQQPPRNLPVLDARSSEILLVSNQIRPGEANQNPLSQWVLDSRPNPARPVDADFNGQLHAFGWAVTTPDGDPVKEVHAGKPYVFRLYYEVIAPVIGEWQTFIHIDGYQRRYNGDHDTLEGKYPFHLWRVGDFIVDMHPFELEPNFTAGTYTVFFGLFRGEQRLVVKRGGGSDNRVNAGPLEVR